MAVNKVDYAATLATASNTDRLPTPAIWGDCPVLDLLEGGKDGAYLFDDFVFNPRVLPTSAGVFGQWWGIGSTGGTAVSVPTGQGSGIVLGSDDDNEGAVIHCGNIPFQIDRGKKKFWFEARVKFSNITDSKIGAFIGLMGDTAITAAVPMADDGTIADANLVGFWRVEGDGDKLDIIYKANGVAVVTVAADAFTLVADTYVKVGMVYEDLGDRFGDYALTFYFNGVRFATHKHIPADDGTDFPNDVGMGPIIALKNAAGSSPGTLTLDWIRAAQLY